VAPNLFEVGPHGTLVIGAPVALAASRCPECGRPEFPRSSVCPACGAATEPISLARGSLVGATKVLHPPPGALVEAPYEVGVAEFDCGISVIGLLIDVDAAELGQAVEVRASRVGDRAGFAFVPVAAGA
jgi:uncharacterized OB-fold protein